MDEWAGPWTPANPDGRLKDGGLHLLAVKTTAPSLLGRKIYYDPGAEDADTLRLFFAGSVILVPASAPFNPKGPHMDVGTLALQGADLET